MLVLFVDLCEVRAFLWIFVMLVLFVDIASWCVQTNACARVCIRFASTANAAAAAEIVEAKKSANTVLALPNQAPSSPILTLPSSPVLVGVGCPI
jgi:hypothetical protein